MDRKMGYHNVLVSPQWLHDNLMSSKIVIVDCRYSLSDFSLGRKMYNAGHIPGAYFMDLEDDLSGPKGTHGGRHPIPDPSVFAGKMSAMGISRGTHVIAYDAEGAASCRLCWLLRYFGHDNVSILQGGFDEWVSLDLPVTNVQPPFRHGDFVPVPRADMVVGRDEIIESGSSMTLVDCRAPERYRGEVEPIDRKAGHIPGAINLFYREVFSGNSAFKTPEELTKVLGNLDSKSVLYCGSGVTAAAVCVAMGMIGMEPRIYAGSWSDWASYEDSPIATVKGSEQ